MNPKIWLELTNIDVIKEGKYLLRNINLKLYEGEIITILGPNGSGKSSLVSLINRTIYPISRNGSSIKIFGKEQINIWQLKKYISIVNHDLNQRINTRITVRDLIQSGLYGSIGINRNEVINSIDLERTDTIINQFGLKRISQERYHFLSDGEKRNVLIARAMISNPKVLILDEPTINLDMKSLFNLFEIIGKLISSKVTIIFITNNIDSILKQTNKIILLKDGMILEQGNPNQIMQTDTINYLYDTNVELLNINGNWRVIPK